MKRPRADYHPGNITRGDDAFKQQAEPPMPHREVTTSRPVLYTHDERPVYRRVGFEVKR